jgi:HEAT repeat protein
VRLEALRAWADARRGQLPIEATDLRGDTDRDVRAAAIRALAGRRHPAAQQYAVAALQDHELMVRTAAIAALGELGGTESRAALAGLLNDQPEEIRAAAVSALAQLGSIEEVLAAVGDRSWRVRLKVAQALAGNAHGNAAQVAHRLLQDPSAAVQCQMVLALAKWPLPQAGPLMLEAMGSRSLTTRGTAAEQLAARWPPAAEFPREGPPQRRSAALEGLQERFREEFSLGRPAAPTEGAADGPLAATIAPQTVDQVAALERLASADVTERREAASQLAELSRGRPSGPLLTQRLAELAVAEPDELVWQSVLTAVADDAGEPSIRLAYAAVSHPSAEIRRRACEHLAAHPSPDHAKILVPTLEDRNEAVVRAAVRALSAAGRLDDTRPLLRVLRTTNEYLRLEAAAALVRLGDPTGHSRGAAALEGLAYSADPKVRCQVALAMGETAEPTFVPTLIRLLDDRPAVCRAALDGLSKTVGQDVSALQDGAPVGTSQRVRRWRQWFDRRQGLAADHR